MTEKETSSFFRNSTLDKERKILCIRCKHSTTHLVQASFLHDWEVDGGYYSYNGSELYEISQCMGCKSITFREETYFSEDVEYDEGEPYGGTKEIFYPERNINHISPSVFRAPLPENIDNIYHETIAAFNAGLLILAAGGLRALVDGIGAVKIYV